MGQSYKWKSTTDILIPIRAKLIIITALLVQDGGGSFGSYTPDGVAMKTEALTLTKANLKPMTQMSNQENREIKK